MIITSVVINIETNGPQDEGLSPKQIVMNGSEWKLPTSMFPRDIRFLSSLQFLIDRYNGR